MTLNDAVKRVKDRSHRGNVDITTDETTAQIIRAVNDARREVVRMLPKNYLWKQGNLVGVQGTATYALASDVQEPIVFSYTTPDNILRIIRKVESEREWFNNIYNPSSPQNFPYSYREIGPDVSGNKQVEIFPSPNAAYTYNYEYYKDPTLTDMLPADLDVTIPDVPSYLVDSLWKGALYYFLKGFDDPAQQIAKADYEQSKLEARIIEEQDLDADNCLRFETDNRFGPEDRTQTGIRLQ